MTAERQRDYRKLHYTWKHRVIASVSNKLNFTYTIRNGLATGMKRRGGLAFVPRADDTIETRFLRALQLANLVVYDVGAFEGIFTLFFSRRARQVISYEPNPQSQRRLEANLKLNRFADVMVRDVALSDRQMETTLIFDPLMPGAASSAASVAAQIRDNAPQKIEVPINTTRLDHEIFTSKLPPPDFVKVDVEGMEASVLRGAEKALRMYRPALYIEMHGVDRADKLKISSEVISILEELGYHAIRDVEAGTFLDRNLNNPPSHLFCDRADVSIAPALA